MQPAQPQLNQKTTSIPAIASLVLTVLSIPGFFCCSPIGCGTAAIAIGLGLIGVFQYHTGSADTASGVMAWISVLLSSGIIILSVTLVGVAGLMGALQEHGVDVPSEYTAPSDSQEQPSPKRHDRR